MAGRTRRAERFAAHWVSPHGGLRLFLGVGDTRESAEAIARRNLPEHGLTGGRDVIRLTPIAWAPVETERRRAG
jgi:hypothetical protein